MRITPRRISRVAASLALTCGIGLAQVKEAGRANADAGSTGGVDHKARQVRPIKLGTSGGNAKNLANGYCCSGTLGALVQIGGTPYLLSNTHVFAGDSVPGGNGRVSTVGDPINQPGLVDVACQDIPNDYVANLSAWSTLNPGGTSTVDAALAKVIPGKVDPSGAILEIGTLSSSTVAAFPGQAVKKSGRTTGLTRSSIDAINASVKVQYSTECAGGTFVTTLNGQILVKNKGSRFLNSGDSGSLMVEDVATNPRAVGLLYAGSSSIAVANPIDAVLAEFAGAAMVGVSTSAGATAISTSLQQTQRDIAQAIRVQRANSARLSSVPKGVGHAVGLDPSGIHIKVLVEELTPDAQRSVPRQLDGIRVVVEEVGQVVAF